MCLCSGNRVFDEYNFLFIIYNLTMIRMNDDKNELYNIQGKGSQVIFGIMEVRHDNEDYYKE